MSILIRLENIFGQPAAVETIRRAHQADRLPHAMIFSGPTGVGKATTAGALGALFLCEAPGPLDACGKCTSCRAMDSASHPDFHVITKELARLHDRSGTSKATQLGINVIRRELNEVAGRKTTIGRGKVFVIEQAELMTSAAQNALLKTLEEPQGRTMIVLLTESLGDLLSTVRSRCQTIRFLPLDVELVRTELIKRGIDEITAQPASEIGDGSFGTALRFIEDGVLAPAAAVADAIDATLFGGAPADIADLLRKSAEAQTEKTLERDELASKDSVMRDWLGVFMSIAARRLRQRLAENVNEATLERACDAIDSLARAEKYLDANVNVSLTLEQLGLSLRPLPV
ncbi:MAG: DNA polymerase III subunit delta' [Planctomycetota bacterium]|nr:DNA polymerase III subunit delta' [Planctomycetota bacterium]